MSDSGPNNFPIGDPAKGYFVGDPFSSYYLGPALLVNALCGEYLQYFYTYTIRHL